MKEICIENRLKLYHITFIWQMLLSKVTWSSFTQIHQQQLWVRCLAQGHIQQLLADPLWATASVHFFNNRGLLGLNKQKIIYCKKNVFKKKLKWENCFTVLQLYIIYVTKFTSFCVFFSPLIMLRFKSCPQLIFSSPTSSSFSIDSSVR